MLLNINKLTDWRQLNGTSLQGYINCDYKTLVKVFGKPQGMYDDYKSDCAWDLVINGVVCTIYNYKDGKNYCGKSGLAKTQITNWHVGGRSVLAQKYVDAALANYFAKQETLTA